MDELKLQLKNCYGIQEMETQLDFSNNNVAIIYAPNGTMKSSLAKTFASLRDHVPVEEKVFGFKSECSITDEQGLDISEKEIIVINPFDENGFEEQGLLMANDILRRKYLNIHKTIEEKKEALYAQIKEALGYSSRSNFEVKKTMLRDWNKNTNEEYSCLVEIKSLLKSSHMTCSLKECEIDYNVLFNDKVVALLKAGNTSDLIAEYEEKYSELVNKSLYMRQGVIDHNNYGNISDSLSNNGFFAADNEVILKAKDGSDRIIVKGQSQLDDLIKKEKEKVLNTKEIKDLFEKINKAFAKNKDTQAFNAFLQDHQEIVPEYKNLEQFKKKVWIKVFKEREQLLIDLLKEYDKAQFDLKMIRDAAKNEVTDWMKALELFKERFYVPFMIETSNQDDVILNMDLPSFKYTFSDDRGDKEVTKESLLNVLSTGERRAYYILNMIFQILVAKKNGQESLLVLDDISESFDYKNKYAIIEYIKDISEYTDANDEKIFKILLLTHNFDFYRTVASRITKRGNSYIAFSDCGTIKLERGHYTKNLFSNYKDRLLKDYTDKIMLASIPFVRNLIEYTEGSEHPDYLLLTNVLHYKPDTRTITLEQIQKIFNDHWFRNEKLKFALGRENERVYDVIMSESERIDNVEKIEIESKLILSMAIRLKAELYMKNKIVSNLPDGNNIIREIYSKKSQSGRMLATYKAHINDSSMNTLELVAMMTPENIHINSFMFEPILDMSLKHLYDLYQDVKNLA